MLPERCGVIVTNNIEYIQVEKREQILKHLALSVESSLKGLLSDASKSAVTVACCRIEKTDLKKLLGEPPESAFLIETGFSTGLRGHSLLAIKISDLIHLAERMAGFGEGKQKQESLMGCTGVLGSVIEESARQFAATHLPISCKPSRLINPEETLEIRESLFQSYEGVLTATYRVTFQSPDLDLDLHFLVEPEVLVSLSELLAHEEMNPVDDVGEPQKNNSMEMRSDQMSNAERHKEDSGISFPNKKPEDGSNWNIDLLLDVELPISVSFGQTEMQLKDILKLGPGSVIELDRSVNDPVILIVNHKPVAKGEVVMVEGNYGVRIIEVESTADRLRSLG